MKPSHQDGEWYSGSGWTGTSPRTTFCVTLDQSFKTSLGLSFLTCEAGLVVNLELRLTHVAMPAFGVREEMV